jgi:hypothetical protein
MAITPLPPAPQPTDSTSQFNSKAFAFVGALDGFVTETNALALEVDSDATTASAAQSAASASATAAASSANYKGAWSGLTGALAIPASVSHLSKVWLLTESVSDVTAEVPGVSSKWIAVSLNFASPDPIGSTTPNSGVFTTVADANGLVRTVPQSGSAKTTSYSLTTGDVGEYIEIGTGGSVTIPDATFAAGDIVSLFNNTSGDITVTCTITTAYIAGTDSDKASVTLATRGVATILFISGTVCVMGGNLT